MSAMHLKVITILLSSFESALNMFNLCSFYLHAMCKFSQTKEMQKSNTYHEFYASFTIDDSDLFLGANETMKNITGIYILLMSRLEVYEKNNLVADMKLSKAGRKSLKLSIQSIPMDCKKLWHIQK